MVVVLLLIALVLLAGGGAALFTGFDILLGDRGLPIIVAGSVLLAAGFVLIGLVVVARAVRRMERSVLDALEAQTEAARLSPSAPAFVSSASSVPAAVTVTASYAGDLRPTIEPTFADPEERSRGDDMPELPLPEPEPAPTKSETAAAVEVERPPPSVVGRYSSAGNSYVMFSDGTIEAETPTGHHRFNSLEELRAFVAAGGEGAAA